MRVGSIGYATYQGLGLLLKDFYDNGIVNHVVTVRHHVFENQVWYRGPSTSIESFDPTVLMKFVEGMDTLFFFETPFYWPIIEYCRGLGKRSILMPMYECTMAEVPKHLDLIINPSLLDQVHYPQGEFIQVPVPDWVRWRLRAKAETFVHNAGHGGLNGRNGTRELLEAMRHVTKPVKLLVRSQEPLVIPNHCQEDKRITFEVGTIDKEQLYEKGDVFVFPEKFNGLSLPLQEAKAAGMLVMGSNRFPVNTWNNSEHLIPVHSFEKLRTNLSRTVTSAIVEPKDIAATIDSWYGRDITDYSLEGLKFKSDCSWRNLESVYQERIRA